MVLIRVTITADTMSSQFRKPRCWSMNSSRTSLSGVRFSQSRCRFVIIPMGDSVKLVGKGLTTGQVHEPILNAEQLVQLEELPVARPDIWASNRGTPDLVSGA